MTVSVFGLGYVGCVSLGCLAQNGFDVIGVDVSSVKVDLINRGLPTIIEKDIDRIVATQHSLGKVIATKDHMAAVMQSDVSIICVGTPNTDHGDLDLSYVYQVARQIGEALLHKKTFHTVIIRSTVLPGTNRSVGEIIQTTSLQLINKDFAVVSNPEFLREGSAVEDYYNPPLTVIGTDSDKAFQIVAGLYNRVSGPIERVSINVAELIKYVNNSYHALKVVFANEIGAICKTHGIDSHEVMRIFCQDKQLNISPYYFKPGFAYGGSCLPKDLKALKTMASDSDVSVPVLNAIEASNQDHILRGLDTIQKYNAKRVGILGVAFKEGTDDLRFSPIINVIEKLRDSNVEVRIHDRYVKEACLIGTNKEFLDNALSFIREMMVDSEDTLISWADLIVFNRNSEQFSVYVKNNPDKQFVDLVRIKPTPDLTNYHGICW